MPFGKFGMGMAVGLAIGAVVPLAAQTMSSQLNSGAYDGIPPNSLISFACSSGGSFRAGVSIEHAPGTIYVGSMPTTSVQLICR